MQDITFFSLLAFFLLIGTSLVSPLHDGPMYDPSAYTECKEQPEKPLYWGGIFQSQPQSGGVEDSIAFYAVDGPSFNLNYLTQDTIYCFSNIAQLYYFTTVWVKIEGSSSSLIRARLKTEHETHDCIGTVLAKSGCWSFLKGGFVLNQNSNVSMLFFQKTDGKDINIELASPSLQPFTKQKWRFNQQFIINTHRKRAVMIHVSDTNGKRIQGATTIIEQVSKDFPFGSAIAKTILGNLPYQNWFVKRFNAAVFENELKWYATEPDQGRVNYTISDQMLQFLRANNIIARGHNILWEDPIYTPAWARSLSSTQLQAAVDSRIQSLMSQYRES